MQTFYLRTRRIAAALLVLALVAYAALSLLGSSQSQTPVVCAAAILAIVFLCSALASQKPRLGFDALAFFAATASAAVSWGGSGLEAGHLAYLPAMVLGIGFATMATVLRAEASMAKTEDRL